MLSDHDVARLAGLICAASFFGCFAALFVRDLLDAAREIVGDWVHGPERLELREVDPETKKKIIEELDNVQ